MSSQKALVKFEKNYDFSSTKTPNDWFNHTIRTRIEKKNNNNGLKILNGIWDYWDNMLWTKIVYLQLAGFKTVLTDS